jgi:hypothetical protein
MYTFTTITSKNLKNLRNIAFLLLFACFGSTLTSSIGDKGYVVEKNAEAYKLRQEKKNKAQVFKDFTTKFKRTRLPKKPKGIKTAVPGVESVIFHEFYFHSDFTPREIEGSPSLFSYYTNCKRGPPQI